ncbi:MAG: MBL fold metallo-hydrolase [Oscillospiraceae bacterium]|nr:MBL fold metallo-hydrolase [Oscillospiraceae bacterium]
MKHVQVTYLNHSGFLVETEGWNLLFDYFPDDAAPGEPGYLTPEQLPRDKGLAVFVSHSHHDHFYAGLSDWRKARPDLLLFCSSETPLPPAPNTFPMEGDAGMQLTRETGRPPLQVSTLPSTDLGVAFLVKAGDFSLYHAGDLNDWYWEGEPEAENAAMSAAYAAQMEKLRGLHFDAAFLPMDPRQEQDYLRGMLGFWKVCRADAVFPMHFWGNYGVFDQMEADSRAVCFRGAVRRISHRGETFVL